MQYPTRAAPTRLAELPRHMSRDSKKLKAAGHLSFSHGKPMPVAEQYQSSLQRDFHKELMAGLGAGNAAVKTTLGSSIRIKWDRGDQTAKGWQSTTRLFNEDMVAKSAEMSRPVMPDLSVHWNFGDEKVKYATQMSEDMNIDYRLGLQMNQASKRDRGPIRSCVTLGDEHAEPVGGDPERYRASSQENFRNFTTEEAEASRGKSAAEIAGKEGRAKPRSAVQFGGGKDDLPANLRFRTTSIMSNVAPDEQLVRDTRLPPSQPVRSDMKLADGPPTMYTTNYGDDFMVAADQEAKGPEHNPDQYRSAIQIGSETNVLDYATAASSDYVNHGTSVSKPVQPNVRSKVVFGDNYDVKWKSVNNDRVDPRLVPGAYVNAREDPGYRGPRKRIFDPDVDPMLELHKRTQVMGGDTSLRCAYLSSYQESLGRRGNEDCKTSVPDASRAATSKISLAETAGAPMRSSYEIGSGKPLDEREVKGAHRAAATLGNHSRIDIAMSGVQNTYETAAKTDYVVPPPFEQFPRCQPAVGGGAKKASQEGAQTDWKTSTQEGFRPFKYAGMLQSTYL
jgi:hypothetical protein